MEWSHASNAPFLTVARLAVPQIHQLQAALLEAVLAALVEMPGCLPALPDASDSSATSWSTCDEGIWT